MSVADAWCALCAPGAAHVLCRDPTASRPTTPANGRATDACVERRRPYGARTPSTCTRPAAMTKGENGDRAGALQVVGHRLCGPVLRPDCRQGHQGQPAADVRAAPAPTPAPVPPSQSTSGCSVNGESTMAAWVNSPIRLRCHLPELRLSDKDAIGVTHRHDQSWDAIAKALLQHIIAQETP